MDQTPLCHFRVGMNTDQCFEGRISSGAFLEKQKEILLSVANVRGLKGISSLICNLIACKKRLVHFRNIREGAKTLRRTGAVDVLHVQVNVKCGR